MTDRSSSGVADTEAPNLDTVLTVLENPIRRRIIQRLSEEPAYPLQLSKELDLGQQLVAKHLKVLERARIVTASSEPSPAGPARKIYAVSQRISMSLAFGSKLFSAKILSFGESFRISSESKVASAFSRRIETISRQAAGDKELPSLAEVIADIDGKMEELEKERAVLLNLRSLAMNEASKAIGGMEVSSQEKRILHYILNERDRTIEGISRMLDMRESLVIDFLKRLREVMTLP